MEIWFVAGAVSENVIYATFNDYKMSSSHSNEERWKNKCHFSAHGFAIVDFLNDFDQIPPVQMQQKTGEIVQSSK